MNASSPFGRLVRYVTRKREVVTGIVTAVSTAEGSVNLQLFTDGVNQPHIDPYVYDIGYAPVRPDDTLEPNTWHWPPRA